jgi:VWFA-related protein
VRILILILALTTIIRAQESVVPQDDDPEGIVRITTNLVQLDVTVLDKKGKHVTDLTADDFIVLENGRPQTITNLSYVSTAEAVDSSAILSAGSTRNVNTLRPEQVRRTMAIVIDDLGLSFQSMHFVTRAIKTFINNQMRPGDLMTVIRTSSGSSGLQQFTSDKRMLLTMVDSIRWNPRSRSGVRVGDAAFAGVDNLEEDMSSHGTLGAVQLIVRGLTEMPGRKSIVLFSDGFRLFREGEETDRVREALNNLVDRANRASTVIYTIDTRGVEPFGLTAKDRVIMREGLDLPPPEFQSQMASSLEMTDGMKLLADETGGRFFGNSNDLSSSVERAIEEQSGYYLVAYKPEASSFDLKTGKRKFNKIKVTLKRKDLVVRSRTGFYGVEDRRPNETLLTRKDKIIKALYSPFTEATVDVRLTALFLNERKGKTSESFVRSLLHVDPQDISLKRSTDGLYHGTLDIAAATLDYNGMAVDSHGTTYSLKLKEDQYREIQRSGILYYMNVPIKSPGAYQLRIAVLDGATENIGSVSQFVEVPDLRKKNLTMSGLVLINSIHEMAKAASERKSSSVINAQSELVVRRFRKGMTIDYASMVYNAMIDSKSRYPSITTRIRLLKEGKEIYAGTPKPLTLREVPDPLRVPVVGRFSLGSNLQPGDYTMHLEISDNLRRDKKKTASQWIDFEIRD